ncbi:siphovirus Gp157 family protein, partial [Cetobacterium sp.]|uniref:siphovirus Gp157 family protein n=1 Tax=Cetobacterium sp. TaxID=2071632 RepID=UPI003F31F888
MKFELITKQNNVIGTRARMLEVKDRWEKFCQTNPIYLELKALEKEVEAAEQIVEAEKENIMAAMFNSNLREMKFENLIFKLKDTSRPSVEIEDLKEIPKEFIRTKVEADKVAIMKYYKETGVLI